MAKFELNLNDLVFVSQRYYNECGVQVSTPFYFLTPR